MIISAANCRRMSAEDVKRLKDGALVTLRCDQRMKKKLGTRCYRVSTRNGLKILIRRDPPYDIRTIRERPGEYFVREGGY